LDADEFHFKFSDALPEQQQQKEWKKRVVILSGKEKQLPA
jgi:hypothetical protein